MIKKLTFLKVMLQTTVREV